MLRRDLTPFEGETHDTVRMVCGACEPTPSLLHASANSALAAASTAHANGCRDRCRQSARVSCEIARRGGARCACGARRARDVPIVNAWARWACAGGRERRSQRQLAGGDQDAGLLVAPVHVLRWGGAGPCRAVLTFRVYVALAGSALTCINNLGSIALALNDNIRGSQACASCGGRCRRLRGRGRGRLGRDGGLLQRGELCGQTGRRFSQ